MSATVPRRRRSLRRWREYGQGLVEYALILSLMVIVIIIILTFIGNVVATNMYSKIYSGFPHG